MIRTSWGSATDRGPVRRLNEDALLAHPPVFLVADGMGGHAAGDVASRVAVEEFSALAGGGPVRPEDVRACFERVADRLHEAAGEQAGAGGTTTMGTTVSGVAVADSDGGAYWLVFNVGDSRVYRCAGGALEQITVDHSLVQELVDSGHLSAEDAREHPQRNVVTRALGSRRRPEPDYWLIPAQPRDRLLVCTDGLTSELPDAVLRDALTSHPDPQDAARWLVDAALAAGARDNVTVVVVDAVQVPGEGRPASGPDDATTPRTRSDRA